MMFAPVLGSNLIPVKFKALLAVVLGLAIYGIVSTGPVSMGAFQLNLWSLAPLIALEMMIGLLIGFFASLPFVGVQMGGLLMGQQMGLGFVSFYNPASDSDADLLGQILFFMALAGFLMIGGLDAIVYGLLQTFQHIPIGTFALGEETIAVILSLLLAACEMALRIAAPVLAIIFLQSIAMGFVAKTVPQLNILSLGFPLRILIGLVILIAGLVVIDEVILDGMNSMLGTLMNWVKGQ